MMANSKPALVRGELRTIAVTTWSEQEEFFERDPVHEAISGLKVESRMRKLLLKCQITRSLETHHGVEILDEAVIVAIKLSGRHIAGRQLPDKAVSVLDTACARLSLLQSADPPRLRKFSLSRSLKISIRSSEKRPWGWITWENRDYSKRKDDLEIEVLKLKKQRR